MDGFNFTGGGGGDVSPLALGLQSVPPDGNFVRLNKDEPDAVEIITDHAKTAWSARNGEALQFAELLAKESREQANRAQRRLKAALERLSGTKPRVTMARYRSGDDAAPQGQDIKFQNWNWYDKLITISCASTMALLLGLGVANVAITILGSGVPVFLEQPYLAWMLGALVPAAAMSIKSGYHLMDLDSSRRTYANGIFGLSGILIVIWVVLFALSFEGVTGEIVWDEFGEDVHSGGDAIGTWRNIVQILGEITIGASLFLVIDPYSGDLLLVLDHQEPRMGRG